MTIRPTPAQMRCLRNVAKYRAAGRTRMDVFLRCIANGWIRVRVRTQSVMTAYSVLTRQGRAALKGGG